VNTILDKAAQKEIVEIDQPIRLPALALDYLRLILDEPVHFCAQAIPAFIVRAGCQPAKLQRNREHAIVPHCRRKQV
jgi:hypothetical protein